MAKQTFEQMLQELDSIVQQLESGTTDLEKSLKQYEKGIALIRNCRQTLSNVQRKIEVLSCVQPDGEAITTRLEDEELTDQQKASSRSARRGYKEDAKNGDETDSQQATDEESEKGQSMCQNNTLF